MKTCLAHFAIAVAVWAVFGLGGDAQGQIFGGMFQREQQPSACQQGDPYCQQQYQPQVVPYQQGVPQSRLVQPGVQMGERETETHNTVQTAPVVNVPANVAGAIVTVKQAIKQGPNYTLSDVVTGTIVESYGTHNLVLTCYHGAKKNGVPAAVTAAGFVTPNGEVIDVDPLNDLAAVDFESGQKIEPIAVAPVGLNINETCYSGGYGHQNNGRLAVRSGRLVGPCPMANGALNNTIAGSTMQGESGGPVLNKRYQLVGLISCTDSLEVSREIVAARNRPIRDFLARVLPAWRKRHGLAEQPNLGAGVDGVNESAKDKATDVLEKVEGVAKAVGTSWLTDALVGLGLTSTPAGWIAAGVIGAGSIWLHRRRNKAKGEQSPSLASQVAEEVDNHSGLKTRIGKRIGKRIVTRLSTKAVDKISPELDDVRQQLEDLKQRVASIPQKLTRIVEPPEIPDSMVVDEKHHTHYVEVPDNREGKCWREASERYANRYPGASNVLKAVESMKDQLMNGQSII